MKQSELKPNFVEYVPERLSEGALYISEQYRTAVHLCCCGCGEEVVTPLSPADWRLRKEGDTVTLYPSIGNWSFTCQSHYWIKRNRVEWAPTMTTRQIARVRRKDQLDKTRYIEEINAKKQTLPANHETAIPEMPRQMKESVQRRLWQAFKKWLGV